MKFIAIDFEATDKVPETSRITEVAAVLVILSGEAGSPIYQAVTELSSLVYHSEYPPQSEEVLRVTGITDEMLREEGRAFYVVMDELVLLGKPDYFVAYNKSYDETLFKAEVGRWIEKQGPEDQKRWAEYLMIPWICIMRDVEHPAHLKCKKLSHLALDYGVPIDPIDLHRAIGDVEVMLKMLDYAQIDLRQVVERMKVPDVMIRAMVPKPWDDGGKGKDAAKAAGFGWQRAPGTEGPEYKNAWIKQVKKDRLDAEKEGLSGYEIKVL